MDIEKLILEVQKFPVLYDQTHHLYWNIEYKDKIWKEIANGLKVKGGADKCKKNWLHIREQLRKSIRRRHISYSRRDVTHHKKYKYEDLLKFLLPHVAERETVCDTLYSEECEKDLDEPDSLENSQKDVLDEHVTTQIDFENQGQGYLTENNTNSSHSFQSFTTEFVKPVSLKWQKKTQGSAPSERMGSPVNKTAKKMASAGSVDAFLVGIAPSLKLLNPILFNQAKSRIFTVVQQLEMKQLLMSCDVPYNNSKLFPSHTLTSSSEDSLTSATALSFPKQEMNHLPQSNYYEAIRKPDETVSQHASSQTEGLW